MARRELRHILEHGPWRDGRPERKDLVERPRVKVARDLRIREERLDLGAEDELPWRTRIKKRPDTHPIAREKEPPAGFVPQRERPFAVHLVHAVFAVLRVKMEDH